MNLLKFFFVSIISITIMLQIIEASKPPKDSKILRIMTSAPNNHHHNHLEFSKEGNEGHQSLKQKHQNGKNKSFISNKELLSKLGLSKMRIPASHSRKRLAVESRHHTRPDDSDMFIIKLPPNPYYYSNQIPVDTKNSIDDYGKSKVSLGFRSNGKPGKIYHWNIPALKKFVSNNGIDGRSSEIAVRHKSNNDISNIIDIKNIPTWSKPWENETIEKSYRKSLKSSAAENKSLKKKKSPVYYTPVKYASTSNKHTRNFHHEYFPGNGKPKGFYVIGKSHKPSYYKELIP